MIPSKQLAYNNLSRQMYEASYQIKQAVHVGRSHDVELILVEVYKKMYKNSTKVRSAVHNQIISDATPE